MQEYVWARKGYYEEQRRLLREQYYISRWQSYYAIVYNPDISYNVRRKTIDKLLPDLYEPAPEMKDPKEWYEKQRAHAKKITEDLKKKHAQLQHRGKLQRKPGQPAKSGRPGSGKPRQRRDGR